MLIWLSCTNRIECCYALGASFRNLFLKSTKYYARYYNRKSFGLEQDMQNLVDNPSGRHSRLGPALSALHSPNDLVLLPHD